MKNNSILMIALVMALAFGSSSLHAANAHKTKRARRKVASAGSATTQGSCAPKVLPDSLKYKTVPIRSFEKAKDDRKGLSKFYFTDEQREAHRLVIRNGQVLDN